MAIGLIGRKAGMTQVFQADGTMVAVSVVERRKSDLPSTVRIIRTLRNSICFTGPACWLFGRGAGRSVFMASGSRNTFNVEALMTCGGVA